MFEKKQVKSPSIVSRPLHLPRLGGWGVTTPIVVLIILS